NCIRRAVLLTAGDVISDGSLMIPDVDTAPLSGGVDNGQLLDRLRSFLDDILPHMLKQPGASLHAGLIELVETALITHALEACDNNQVQAAALLGISRNTLRQRLKKQQDLAGQTDAEG
ncbi:MAG: helix-turn-helix domain-containing protein, partial [Thermodesulfobacteriota bacterium]